MRETTKAVNNLIMRWKNFVEEMTVKLKEQFDEGGG